MTQLTQTISLLYRMTDSDRRQLSEHLLNARKAAWSTAIRAVAAEHGCNQAQPSAPRREDLAELKRQSDEDAASIVETWNRDVMAQVEKLYAANVRGNRTYYTSNLERWDAERQAWKLPQIALNTDTVTTAYARRQFYAANGLRGAQWIFTGAPPTCLQCVELFAAGVVDQAFVDAHPAPAHINCPHQWKPVQPERIDCGEMWVG